MIARTRGQHAGLSAQDIVDAAIRIADDRGLSALSMRGIGTELEVEAMALYHHFPNKAALLDAVVEDLATSVPIVDLTDEDWQDGLRDYARAQLETLSAHPELVRLVMSRPAVTPGNLALMETLLEFLGDAGFSPRRALDMVYVVNEFVLMHAALDSGYGTTAAPRGEQGQNARLAAASTDSLPLLAEAVERGHDRSPSARFEFALDALIAGFEELRGNESS